MGPEIHVSKINCTTSKYLTNYYAYTHTLAGIPNGQLDGHIPGHDAAGTQRCVRREGRCGPEGRARRSGKSEGMSNKWPRFFLNLTPAPTNTPPPIRYMPYKVFLGPTRLLFQIYNNNFCPIDYSIDFEASQKGNRGQGAPGRSRPNEQIG